MKSFFRRLLGEGSKSQNKTTSYTKNADQHPIRGSMPPGQDVGIIPVQQIIHIEIIFNKDTWTETESQWVQDASGHVLKLLWPEMWAAFKNLKSGSCRLVTKIGTSAESCNTSIKEESERLNSNVVIQPKTLRLSPSPDPATGFDCGIWLCIHLSGRKFGDPGTVVLIAPNHSLLPAR